jgi:hypothetical protein
VEKVLQVGKEVEMMFVEEEEKRPTGTILKLIFIIGPNHCVLFRYRVFFPILAMEYCVN